MGEVIFNGVSTSDLGVVIQTPPPYEFPTKDYSIHHVAGKSGDILIDTGSYQNIKKTYYLATMFRQNTNFVTNANSIVEWLTSPKGYAKLEDSYEPEYYRMCMFRQQGEIRNLFDKAASTQITFECKPQRYLKSGDVPIEITQKDTFIRITNNTDQIALPEIIVDGETLTITFVAGEDNTQPEKESQASITFTGEGTIDSELQDCYNDTSFLNSQVSLTNGFPKLYPGVNWVKVSGTTLNTLKIKPRWWTL